LCTTGGFASGLEQHVGRPFQQLFSQRLQRYALANQLDYLLLRAEQELRIRSNPQTGVLDGGLEQDFFIYTKLFYRKGYLSSAEYSLCERHYQFYRQALPPADLTVWLQAPTVVIRERFANRQRDLQIARLADLELIEQLLQDWMSESPPAPLITIDASAEDQNYQKAIQVTLSYIDTNLDKYGL
jgi:deoxyadenosine/deoxycytidine kinase